MRKYLRHFSVLAGWIIAVFIFITVIANVFVNKYADKYLYDDIHSIPANEYCLLLGTSKYVIGGDNNPYFDNRINAAFNLWNSGKVKRIIVSGDNREENYNEPEALKRALIKHGVPDSLIFKDRDGYRTLNSILSCKAKFDLHAVTIVTQEFHNSRAVFLARQFGVDAIGFNADDISCSEGYKTRVREWFAKVKAIIDVL
jgi:SanA protein